MNVVTFAIPTFFLSVAFLFTGCRHSPDTATDSASLAMTCSADVDPDVVTVINVTCLPPGPATTSVTFGPAGEESTTTPTASSQESVSLELIGYPSDTDIEWTVTSDVDGTVYTSSGVTRTGVLPDDIPLFGVSIDERAMQHDAPYIIGTFYELFGSMGRLMALDRYGRIVWYAYSDPYTIVIDVQPSRDGVGVIYNQFDVGMAGGDGVLRHITYGGDVVQEWVTPASHHVFCQLPDGTLTFQQLDARVYTEPTTGVTDQWIGDALAEIPPGGEATTVFSVWDWLEPTFNDYMFGPTFYNGMDWTHGNAIKYDEESNQYTLSLGHAGDILVIDRSDYSVVESFGNVGISGVPAFDYQHDPSWLDEDTLLMFSTDPDGHSGAVQYDVDRKAGIMTETWRAGFDVMTAFLGVARRLPNGNTFIGYSANGRLQEVTADGTVVWQADTEGTMALAMTIPIESFYPGPSQ